jgi:hypothetical protein
LSLDYWSLTTDHFKEGKSYEKENLFSWNGFVFCFGDYDELCPRTKNNPYEEQSADAQRNLGGVDDL